jgi:hypothetical protein
VPVKAIHGIEGDHARKGTSQMTYHGKTEPAPYLGLPVAFQAQDCEVLEAVV